MAQAPCALKASGPGNTVTVDGERCNLCGLCLAIGCPALGTGDDAVEIGETCTGCGVCAEVCRRGALAVREPAGTSGVSTTTVSLVGVGGQGILLAAAVLANAALMEGLDVKASEVKGMAQRGGSVVSTVRFGATVASPLAAHANVVIATELLEGRRALPMLVQGGTLVCSGTRIVPGSVLRREAEYPEDLAQAAAARGLRLVSVDAERLAAQAGTTRAANVVLLGAASAVLPFGQDSWERALELAVPAKILALNRRAFALGREAT